jgi:hypothetical protein
MGGQFGPRGGEQLPFSGAPVEAREKLVLPAVRPPSAA